MTDGDAPAKAACGNRRRAVAVLLVIGAALAWWLPANPEDEARLWRTYRITGMFQALGATAAAAAGLYVLLGGGERKRRVFRVVLAAFAGGLCLAAAETPAVLFGRDYRGTFGTKPSDTWLQIAGGINREDPELIQIHKPHDTYEGEVTGNLAYLGLPGNERHRVSLRYDRNGFRNDRDLDHAEVVALGDSFVEAAIVPRAETVSSRIEERLGTTVANLGQEGYGLRQELAVLRRFALPLRPRLVLWFLFGGNDLRDVEEYESLLRALAEGPPPVPLRDRMFLGNALLALSRLTTPARGEPSPVALSNSAIFARADGVRERVYFGDGTDPYDDHSWQVATETLAEADRLCREAGATLVVVYVTRKFRVYRAHVEIAAGTAAAGWAPSDLPDRVAKWTAERGIAFVDLTPALEREVAKGVHPYLVDDVHWNARGHAIAAGEVVAALARLGWSAQEKLR